MVFGRRRRALRDEKPRGRMDESIANTGWASVLPALDVTTLGYRGARTPRAPHSAPHTSKSRIAPRCRRSPPPPPPPPPTPMPHFCRIIFSCPSSFPPFCHFDSSSTGKLRGLITRSAMLELFPSPGRELAATRGLVVTFTRCLSN